MGMNSCLYQTEIMHHRFLPRQHRFQYSFFSFYLDLDEIDEITRRISLVSRNRFNLYSFYDADHMNPAAGSVRAGVTGYLKSHGIEAPVGRVMLLTFLRFCGYVFNPVSFYFCFNSGGDPLCVIPEIGNTFGEMKPFLISSDHLQNNAYTDSQVKYYYISPFTRLDDSLDFKLSIPGDRLGIFIDTSRRNEKLIVTSMTGSRLDLTAKNLLLLTAKFPFVTLKVITLIHWHALRLWARKIPFELKESNPHLQKEVYRVSR